MLDFSDCRLEDRRAAVVGARVLDGSTVSSTDLVEDNPLFEGSSDDEASLAVLKTLGRPVVGMRRVGLDSEGSIVKISVAMSVLISSIDEAIGLLVS